MQFSPLSSQGGPIRSQETDVLGGGGGGEATADVRLGAVRDWHAQPCVAVGLVSCGCLQMRARGAFTWSYALCRTVSPTDPTRRLPPIGLPLISVNDHLT